MELKYPRPPTAQEVYDAEALRLDLLCRKGLIETLDSISTPHIYILYMPRFYNPGGSGSISSEPISHKHSD